MKSEIALLLKKILDIKNVKLSKEEIENYIETPSSDYGDFALPCFFLAKKLRLPPQKIALELKNELTGKSKIFSFIRVDGAYLNFFINKKEFAEKTIKRILKEGENYGKENIGKGKKVLVEHTSINPNASPHVGRARNAIIGDSLVKTFRFFNFKPEVHYYVNDVSKQMAMLVLANAENLKFEGLLKKYAEMSKKVENSKETEEKVFEILNKFESNNKKIAEKFRKITNIAVKGQKKILANLGIHYDFFDYESKYMHKTGKIIEDLKKTKMLFMDENGRYVLDLKGTSVEGKMKSPVLVLTRKDGTGLYPLRDIVYTIEKIKKSKDNLIVLGEDQKLYFQQISETLKILGYNSPKAVHYSFILLNDGGKSKKMSTRKGDVVLLEDFLTEAEKKSMKKTKNKKIARDVGIAAVKYSILKNHPNKMISFNLDEALNFEGDTGPYLMYSYARASSILRKAKNGSGKIPAEKISEKEFELIKKLSQFPEIILSSYKTLNPSAIANYSYQLAQVFNEFYHATKVLGSENENFLLALVQAFRIVLKNSLKLLGIEVIEKM